MLLCTRKQYAGRIDRENKGNKKMIKKPQALIDQIENLPIGKEEEIPTSLYRATTIRSTITKLRKRGHEFICTEKGCINSIKVTRLA